MRTLPDIDTASDFYLMAATLMYIKSRVLLPIEADFDDEFEDPRQELVERLIEYQKYKKLTALIAEQQPQTDWTVEREKNQRKLPFPDDPVMWQELHVWELLNTFSQIVSGLVPERIINLYEEVTINEKVTLIHEKIQHRDEFFFFDIITRPNSIMDIICAFLAVLELVKSRIILIYQNQFFGDIIIRPCRSDVNAVTD